LLFATGLVCAYYIREYFVAIFFGFFAAVGVYIIFEAGKFTIDSESVTHPSLLGIYRLPWEEIR